MTDRRGILLDVLGRAVLLHCRAYCIWDRHKAQVPVHGHSEQSAVPALPGHSWQFRVWGAAVRRILHNSICVVCACVRLRSRAKGGKPNRLAGLDALLPGVSQELQVTGLPCLAPVATQSLGVRVELSMRHSSHAARHLPPLPNRCSQKWWLRRRNQQQHHHRQKPKLHARRHRLQRRRRLPTQRLPKHLRMQLRLLPTLLQMHPSLLCKLRPTPVQVHPQRRLRIPHLLHRNRNRHRHRRMPRRHPHRHRRMSRRPPLRHRRMSRRHFRTPRMVRQPTPSGRTCTPLTLPTTMALSRRSPGRRQRNLLGMPRRKFQQKPLLLTLQMMRAPLRLMPMPKAL